MNSGMTKHTTRSAMALITRTVALISVISLASAYPAPKVSFYLSEESGVLDLNWDSAPQNLQQQLEQFGLSVEVATHGQPQLVGASSLAAYVIPVQNGHNFYSSAEDMRKVAEYVAAGGLVVLLDAAHSAGAATRDFVLKVLGYQGEAFM